MKFAFVVAALLAAVAAPASAQTVASFDDVGSFQPVPTNYLGLTWDRFFARSAGNPESGFKHGLISGTKVAYNDAAALATVSSASAFTFNSGYFTGGWSDGLTITVTGFVGGVATYVESFVVDSDAPTFRVFDWTNLSKVTFIGNGGTFAGYGGRGNHIVFDDLTFNGPLGVPEPAAWGMMIGGFGIAGAALRRRSTKVALAI